jgi:ketosteroid isomerase-like protein
MAEPNVEVARRALVAANRKPPDIETIDQLIHPDHEFVSRLDALEGRVHVGVGGYREWRSLAEQDVEWETQIESVKQIDDDRVLAVMPTSYRGKLSGVAMSADPLAAVVTLRGGKLVRTEVYGSAEEALRAAGLEP